MKLFVMMVVVAIVVGCSGSVQQRSASPQVCSPTEDPLGWEVTGSEPVRSRIRIFTTLSDDSDPKSYIMITAGTCPSRAPSKGSCKNGASRPEETTKCIGSHVLRQDRLWVSIDKRSRAQVTLGTPTLIKQNNLSRTREIEVYRPDEQDPFIHTNIRQDDMSDPLPSEVVALVSAGLEREASSMFKELPQERRTADFETVITRARVEAVTRLSKEPRSFEEVLAFVRAHPIHALPGDQETSRALWPVMTQAVQHVIDLEEPTDEQVWTGAVLLGIHVLTVPGDRGPVFDAFEAKYGPWLLKNLEGTEKARSAFLTVFPDSSYSKEIQRAVEGDRLGRQLEQETSRDFEVVADAMRHVLDLRFKADLGEKSKDMMLSRRRGMAVVRAVRAEADRVHKTEFCPAKMGFIEKHGMRTFVNWARDYCKNEPPTQTTAFGTEIRLQNECQAEFDSRC